MLTEKEKQRIDYIYKRIDYLHKSFTRKMLIFTIIVINIYFGKLWDLVILNFNYFGESFSKGLYKFLSFLDTNIGKEIGIKVNAAEIMNNLGIFDFFAGIINFLPYFSFLAILILTFLIASSDRKKINILELELKKYDRKNNLHIKEDKEFKIIKVINKIIDYFDKKVY